MMRRPDPTVWGEADGPFTTDQVAAYDAKGFHIEDGLLTPAQVQTCWTEFERLAADPRVDASGAVVRERGSDAVRSIFAVHRYSRVIDALARTPRILDRARQILGSDVYIHQSRINAMPGMVGTGFGWHSDFETWHAEDGLPAPRTVSLSIALTDNFAFNGGLMLMPGAHRVFVPCVGETPDDNFRESLQKQKAGVPSDDAVTELGFEYGIEQFTGAAGAALFFDSNSMHASSNNITPYSRANVFLVFNSVENAPLAPFGAESPRPNYIADRDTTPLVPIRDTEFA
ncbi:ectoine hydroxylase [Gordonia liuliyuniae]|uniref:Ectoine hydroxylase n=1 Tax=Gordonia liuliyuniae TaxID=2911517 RepID=A0ABS9ITN4_9ACTN|nr:ectoine hydroxylase [Gordonia liuliyuniae]MCF8588881.1 ectoine hydroxylase [Gordonia liuliyuniae]